MYNAYIVKIDKLDPHPNADRLQLATIFGEVTCVSLDVKIGDIGIYFPVDGQLSLEYCDHNHMCRKAADGSPDTGYLERDQRRVKAIKLRGVKSEGIFCPLDSISYTKVDMSLLTPGFAFTQLNGFEICTKYIPRSNRSNRGPNNQKNSITAKINYAPLFEEHADTEQLAYNLEAFQPGDQIEITLKMHGTSQRTGYLPVFKGYKSNIPFIRKLLQKDPNTLGATAKKIYYHFAKVATPIYDWGYVTGTRRTVLKTFDSGFYGSNAFRKPHAEAFEGKLQKGETVYYEVVGFTDSQNPIMGSCSNKKIEDKEFRKQYGDTTVFSYGCAPNADDGTPQSRLFVYRMTMTNEDGFVVEYTPDYMRYRCEQMGINTVPLLCKATIPVVPTRLIDFTTGEEHDELPGDWVKDIAEQFYDGPDPVGKTHIREGVVVRIVNRPKFTAYKHKNWYFKVLSGIAIEQAEKSGALDNLDADVISEL